MGKEPSVTSPPSPSLFLPSIFFFSYLFLFPSFRRVFRRAPFFPLRLPAVVFFARARARVLLRAPPLRRSILIRARTSAQVNLYENGCRTRCRR